MIILNAVPISLWAMLGKENLYLYTRHYNNNDRWSYLKERNSSLNKNNCMFEKIFQYIKIIKWYLFDLDHWMFSINKKRAFNSVLQEINYASL
jgi:hypothetical protein